MRRLVPHLQQALRTQYHLDDLSNRSNDLAGASEAVRHGIVVVAPGHRVVYTNSAADRILRAVREPQAAGLRLAYVAMAVFGLVFGIGVVSLGKASAFLYFQF